MDDKDSLLAQAAAEIRSLRSQNQIMAAKLEVFDGMMMMLKTQPFYQSVGMSLDLVWQIEKALQTPPATQAQNEVN